MTTRPTRRALPALLALMLAACASDTVRHAQLEPGMTRAVVEKIEGTPDQVETSGAYTAIRYGKAYWVILENDKVIAFGQGTIAKYPGTDRFFINESYP